MFSKNILSSMHKAYIDAFNGLIRLIPLYNTKRLSVVQLSNAEHLSLLGVVYIAEITTTIAAGQSKWFRFAAPSDKDVIILERDLMPDVSGAKYNLYFSATGYSDDATNIVKIQTLNPIPGIPSTSVIKSLSAAPSGLGTGFTLIKTGATSSNSAQQQSTGTLSSRQGLQTYVHGSGVFFGEIHNSANISQEITFRITLAEIQQSLFT